MRIRLKDSFVLIEVSSCSKYLNLLNSSLQRVQTDRVKKEQFLKSIYFICAKLVDYHNPIFYQKLIKSAHKEIRVLVQSDNSLKPYYNVLGASELDSMQIVRKKYLKLAKTYHPDRVSYTNVSLVDEYTRLFQEIQNAYEVVREKKVA